MGADMMPDMRRFEPAAGAPSGMYELTPELHDPLDHLHWVRAGDLEVAPRGSLVFFRVATHRRVFNWCTAEQWQCAVDEIKAGKLDDLAPKDTDATAVRAPVVAAERADGEAFTPGAPRPLNRWDVISP